MANWNPAAHPRGAPGSGQGGRFISATSNPKSDKAAAGAKRKLGNLNAARIRAYQRANGLKVDGIIGHQTAEALLGNRNASRIAIGALTVGQRRALAALGAASGYGQRSGASAPSWRTPKTPDKKVARPRASTGSQYPATGGATITGRKKRPN